MVQKRGQPSGVSTQQYECFRGALASDISLPSSSDTRHTLTAQLVLLRVADAVIII